MNPVYLIFNDIANAMLTKADNEEFMTNVVKVNGAKNTHELSVNQLQLFLGIISGDHAFLSEYNPLEFLIFSYQIQDKFNKDWLAVQYRIIYDTEDDSIFLSGVCAHPSRVEGHPQYDPESQIPVVPFHEHIPDVGLYGSLALVNCIAAQTPEFNPIRGSFGGSFIYEHKDGQQTIRRYEPTPAEELNIDTDELLGAIDRAKKAILTENKTE